MKTIGFVLCLLCLFQTAFAKAQKEPCEPWTLTGSAFGLFPFKANGLGLGYQFDKRAIVEFKILQMVEPLQDQKANLGSLGLKFLAGRSFYFEMGTAISQKTSMRIRYDETYENSTISNERGSSLDVQLGIGNRWALGDGIFIGVDWLTVQLPMQYLGGNKEISAENRGQIGRVYLGLQF